MINISDLDLWFRIPNHHQFDPGRVYKAVAISDYSESATAQIFFITDNGFLWAIPQTKCLCVSSGYSRPAEYREMQFKLPNKGEVKSDW
jgi:hypothetical protein